MIEFKDVSFQYEQGSSKGKIENINLTIHDGEVVLICGESGCGRDRCKKCISVCIVWRCWLRLSESKNTVFYGGYHQRNCVWMREFGNQCR